MAEEVLSGAFGALADADAALVKLEKLCCEPARSPRMAALAETLSSVRADLASDKGADTLFEHLEDAGGQLGRLQVGCCAENRLPLYSRMLEDLTKIQLEVNRVRGQGH